MAGRTEAQWLPTVLSGEKQHEGFCGVPGGYLPGGDTGLESWLACQWHQQAASCRLGPQDVSRKGRVGSRAGGRRGASSKLTDSCFCTVGACVLG